MIRPGVVERIVAAGLDDSPDARWVFRALKDAATASEKYAAWGLIWSSLLVEAERAAGDAGAAAARFDQLGVRPDVARSLWDTWLRAEAQRAELAAEVAGCVGRGE